MDERILKFLYDIQQCISKIETYTVNQTQEAYLKDEKTQDAVERNFEIIGEAVNNIRKIDSSIKDFYPAQTVVLLHPKHMPRLLLDTYNHLLL